MRGVPAGKENHGSLDAREKSVECSLAVPVHRGSRSQLVRLSPQFWQPLPSPTRPPSSETEQQVQERHEHMQVKGKLQLQLQLQEQHGPASKQQQ